MHYILLTDNLLGTHVTTVNVKCLENESGTWLLTNLGSSPTCNRILIPTFGFPPCTFLASENAVAWILTFIILEHNSSTMIRDKR